MKTKTMLIERNWILQEILEICKIFYIIFPIKALANVIVTLELR